jgi:hypothetical protein
MKHKFTILGFKEDRIVFDLCSEEEPSQEIVECLRKFYKCDKLWMNERFLLI